MRGAAPPLRSFPITLVLGLLLAVGVGTIQTTSAQQPSFTLDQPVQSFEKAVATVDSEDRLLDLTTAWMEARADTKIPYSTYQKGVRILKDSHPGFYGNFFGHPFYATYDADYFAMSRHRRITGREVNPFNGLSGMFFCHPVGYDPAFNGRCRGITFAVLDFFFLPPGFKTARASAFMPLYPRSSSFCRDNTKQSGWCGSLYAGRSARTNDRRIDDPQRPDERPRRPDTVRTGFRTPSTVASAPRDDGEEASSRSPTPSIDGNLSSVRVTPIQTPDRPALEIDVPDNAHQSIQETVSSLRRTERRLRLRQQIRRQYGAPQSLTPEERARLTSELANRSFSPNERGPAWTRGRTDNDSRPRRRPRTESPRPEWTPPRHTPETRRPTADNPDAQNESATDRSPNPPKQRRKPKSKDPKESDNN